MRDSVETLAMTTGENELLTLRAVGSAILWKIHFITYHNNILTPGLNHGSLDNDRPFGGRPVVKCLRNQ